MSTRMFFPPQRISDLLQLAWVSHWSWKELQNWFLFLIWLVINSSAWLSTWNDSKIDVCSSLYFWLKRLTWRSISCSHQEQVSRCWFLGVDRFDAVLSEGLEMLLLLLMILTKQDNEESEREGQMLLEISCFLIDWLVLSLVGCALIRFRLGWPSPAE